uniref:Putative secreted protein n=3 Tax=Nyssorhynchus TaxID=44543 RepID=A0A2M4D0F2_ANODA
MVGSIAVAVSTTVASTTVATSGTTGAAIRGTTDAAHRVRAVGATMVATGEETAVVVGAGVAMNLGITTNKDTTLVRCVLVAILISERRPTVPTVAITERTSRRLTV